MRTKVFAITSLLVAAALLSQHNGNAEKNAGPITATLSPSSTPTLTATPDITPTPTFFPTETPTTVYDYFLSMFEQLPYNEKGYAFIPNMQSIPFQIKTTDNPLSVINEPYTFTLFNYLNPTNPSQNYVKDIALLAHDTGPDVLELNNLEVGDLLYLYNDGVLSTYVLSGREQYWLSSRKGVTIYSNRTVGSLNDYELFQRMYGYFGETDEELDKYFKNKLVIQTCLYDGSGNASAGRLFLIFEKLDEKP